MLIYLIQKTNDTLTPLRNLPTKGNIGEDRETLLFQYRENNKIMQEKRKERLKTKIVLNPKMPISPALMSDFKEEVVKVKPDRVESVDELRKVDWQRDTLKILLHWCSVLVSSNPHLCERLSVFAFLQTLRSCFEL